MTNTSQVLKACANGAKEGSERGGSWLAAVLGRAA